MQCISTPEVTSFFSQHEHFEYSQLSVETFAYATDDDWEIDYHRRELIRHHKTLRSQLFKISGSKCPISFDDLESTRTTFIVNGTKKVERTTGEQSLVQRNVLTNNGVEELFSRSRQEPHFLLKSCLTSSLPVSP